MNITYRQCEKKDLEAVRELQNEWFFENMTFGVAPENTDQISGYMNEYFSAALDGGSVIGYITAEVIDGNEYNVFPKGSKYLRVNDLYVAKEYRSRGIGAELLAVTEKKAFANGLRHIFISSAARDSDAIRRFYGRNGYGIWTTMFYKRSDWETRIYSLNELDGYRFVVIFSRYRDRWLYCRAKDRDVFETAGGHIEKGETTLQAAKRELYEETGALDYDIKPVFDYSVHTPDDFSNGQVFLADIHELGRLPDFEMAEVKLYETIPDRMRFPQILPVLFGEISLHI